MAFHKLSFHKGKIPIFSFPAPRSAPPLSPRASPARAPLLHQSGLPLTASPLDWSPLGDRQGGGDPSHGLRPATLPTAGSTVVALPPCRPCSPVRLWCAASGEPPPQLLLAGSLPDLQAPDARRFPAPLCGSLLLPAWWLAPSPNSLRHPHRPPSVILSHRAERSPDPRHQAARSPDPTLAEAEVGGAEDSAG